MPDSPPAESDALFDSGPPEQEAPRPPAPRPGCRRVLLWGGLALVFLGAGTLYEVRTSRLQSVLFTRLSAELRFELAEGPSDRIVFPEVGPFDQRLGYTRIPRIADRLDSLGFVLTHQARVSERFLRAVELGAYPVYREKTSAGLLVLDRRGLHVVDEVYPSRAYASFDSIPDLVWRTLLFVETRDFLDPRHRRKNPAVEWSRLVRAGSELGLKALGVERNVPGGSTLATQIEKYRHSPDGLTRTPRDKLRQMVTASLRAYWDGPDTFQERKDVVADYLNSVPLAAQVGHGEVIGTADGLWAWYGADLAEVNDILRGDPRNPAARARKGEAYRRVLGLLLAHRRPSYYLTRPEGRRDLADLVDAYITLLDREHVIPSWLADETRGARGILDILDRAPEPPAPNFTERKARTLVRTHLLRLAGVPSLYQLDRLDMQATSTLDLEWHEAATELLRSLRDSAFLRANGFMEDRLLDTGNPSGVLYSVTLLESTPTGNKIRVQTDNFDGPLSLVESSRLELGSTAKLRTLVTYLEIVEELYLRLSALPADSLGAPVVSRNDGLTRWAVETLRRRPEVDLRGMLEAVMKREYSASPSERFATGGGVQSFANFDAQFDHRMLTVAEAFRQSVNLPFIRIMRDIVAYVIHRGGLESVLQDPVSPARAEYLTRFAEAEGARFVRQYYGKYADRTGPEIFEALVSERRLGVRRLAWAYRAVAPDADLELFGDFIARFAPDEVLREGGVADLYRRADPSGLTLSDIGFLAGVHPLELWVAGYVLHHPGAALADVLDASLDARVAVYGWLFRTRSRAAQDDRIRSMVEMEAFQDILRRWRRVGYPFENIVPSLGTAIGSSGDRPLALAELAGILLNGGVRRPLARLDAVHLAEGTPFETRLERRSEEGARVLSEAVAAEARATLEDVVAAGTGRRVRSALRAADGSVLTLGGKTGTGDNRFRVFARGGALVESRVVNRTATFVFLAGDRYFGVVTAYVQGPEAGGYRFTSGLPTQILRVLGPRLRGLSGPVSSSAPPAEPASR